VLGLSWWLAAFQTTVKGTASPAAAESHCLRQAMAFYSRAFLVSGVAQKYGYISKMIFGRFNGNVQGYKRTDIYVQHHQPNSDNFSAT